MKYLELRTTPKEYLKNNLTYENYIESIIKVFKEFSNKIILKLLLSVNRRDTMYYLFIFSEKAFNTVQLCNKFHDKYPEYVIGIDLSGDPNGEDFDFYSDIFSYCRDCNLYVTCHCAEIDRKKDTDSIIQYEPDRLGHCLLLNDEQFEQLKKIRIPIEICPTSNMKTLQLPTLKQHPILKNLIDNKYPFLICTDDPGLFKTNQMIELELFMTAFNISPRDMLNLQILSINFTFSTDEEKQKLKDMFNKYSDEVFGILG